MIGVFERHPLLAGGTILCIALGLLFQVIVGNLYASLIHDADNMASTENPILKQCKLKFVNCYKLNDGVANVSIFVDKFVGKIKYGRIYLSTLSGLSSQWILFGVLVAGLGAARGIVSGETIGSILPFYVYAFLGLYFYFSLTSFINPEEKRRNLKICLMDYLENHMMGRMVETDEALNRRIKDGIATEQTVQMVQEKSGVGKTSMDNIEISEKKRMGKDPDYFQEPRNRNWRCSFGNF